MNEHRAIVWPVSGLKKVFADATPLGAAPTSWMVVRLNGKSYPIGHLIDVTDAIKPAGSNSLTLPVINKFGSGGPLGHVTLLTGMKPDQQQENTHHDH